MCDFIKALLFLPIGHGNPRRVKLEELLSLLYNMATDTLTVHMSIKTRMKLVNHLEKFLKKEK